MLELHRLATDPAPLRLCETGRVAALTQPAGHMAGLPNIFRPAPPRPLLWLAPRFSAEFVRCPAHAHAATALGDNTYAYDPTP